MQDGMTDGGMGGLTDFMHETWRGAGGHILLVSCWRLGEQHWHSMPTSDYPISYYWADGPTNSLVDLGNKKARWSGKPSGCVSSGLCGGIERRDLVFQSEHPI